MEGFVLFDTVQEFNTWHESVNAARGFPDGNGTDQYTYCIEHPTNGTVIGFQDNNCPNDLMLDIAGDRAWAIENGYIKEEEMV